MDGPMDVPTQLYRSEGGEGNIANTSPTSKQNKKKTVQLFTYCMYILLDRQW